MRSWIVVVVLCWAGLSAHAQNSKPLSGVTVVIDPGHGGADPGCLFGMRINGMDYTYYEAAYTYAAAYDLRDLVEQFGGTAYLTCKSKQAEAAKPASALDPRPLPRDAVYASNGHAILRSADGGLKDRAAIASKIYAQLRNGKCYFISLHIDSYGSRKWSGSHVCYQKDREIPTLARAVAARIELYGCPRCKDGEPIGSGMSARNFSVLRDNTIPEAVLLEMAVPANSGDSFRMRSDENRRRYLAAVVLSALIDLQAEQPLSQYTQNQTNELIRQQFGSVEPNPTPADEIEQPSSMPSMAWHWILGFTGFGTLFGFWWILIIAMLIAIVTNRALSWLFDKLPRQDSLANAIISTSLLLFCGTTVLFGSRLWWLYFATGLWSYWQDCRQNGFRRHSGAWIYCLLTIYLAPIGLVAIYIMDTLAIGRKVIVKWRSR